MVLISIFDKLYVRILVALRIHASIAAVQYIGPVQLTEREGGGGGDENVNEKTSFRHTIIRLKVEMATKMDPTQQRREEEENRKTAYRLLCTHLLMLNTEHTGTFLFQPFYNVDAFVRHSSILIPFDTQVTV